jgi:hypothetical protein
MSFTESELLLFHHGALPLSEILPWLREAISMPRRECESPDARGTDRVEARNAVRCTADELCPSR